MAQVAPPSRIARGFDIDSSCPTSSTPCANAEAIRGRQLERRKRCGMALASRNNCAAAVEGCALRPRSGAVVRARGNTAHIVLQDGIQESAMNKMTIVLAAAALLSLDAKPAAATDLYN